MTRRLERQARLRRYENRKYIQLQAKHLNKMWSELHAPSINSCWRTFSNVDHKRTPHVARRLFCHFKKREIPEGFELHHTCHNGWCVNPKHLKLLTFSDHLKEHGKKQHVSYRSYNKYARMIRDLIENDKEISQLITNDQE